MFNVLLQNVGTSPHEPACAGFKMYFYPSRQNPIRRRDVRMHISHTLAPRLSPYFCFFFFVFSRVIYVKSNISVLFKDDVFKEVGKIILIPSETTHVARYSLYISCILVVEKIKGKNNSYEHFPFFFFFTPTCLWSND